MSASDRLITTTLRPGSPTSRPSCIRRCNASRTGPRLIRSSSASPCSVTWSPGAKRPPAMASRSCSAIAAAVDLRAIGCSGICQL